MSLASDDLPVDPSAGGFGEILYVFDEILQRWEAQLLDWVLHLGLLWGKCVLGVRRVDRRLTSLLIIQSADVEKIVCVSMVQQGL